MHWSREDAQLVVESLVYRARDHPSDSKEAMRCRLLAREIADAYGVDVNFGGV